VTTPIPTRGLGWGAKLGINEQVELKNNRWWVLSQVMENTECITGSVERGETLALPHGNAENVNIKMKKQACSKPKKQRKPNLEKINRKQ
jgi:hypothetical protein